ncbi:MAG: hypothetical protein IT181_15035 [Acidobacteria bacterium]|nr:hypothetical protein [Acidobacteriota bacterium]
MSTTTRLVVLLGLTALVAACSNGNADDGSRRTLQRLAPVAVERPAVPGVDGPVGMTRVNPPASVWVGAAATTRRTADAMFEQARRGVVAMDWRTRPRAKKQKPARTALSQSPLTLAPVAADAPAASDRASAPAVAQTAASPNVDVATIADTGALPPDTMGDIGPTQYLVGLNGRIRTIAKSTGVADGALDLDTDVFFPSALRGAGVTTDPRVRYDRRTNRWFVLMITIAVPNRFVMAVSDGPTITAGTVWAQYQWANTRTEAGSGAFGCLADYPSLGIDEDALYIGVNQFCGADFNNLGFDSVSVYALNKAALVGGTLSVAQFDGVLPTFNSSGIYSPQGVDNVDSNTNAGFVIGVDNAFFGSLVMHRISSPGAAPSISGPIAVAVAPTAVPVDVPHPGGTLPLDGLDDRLLQAIIRNGRLWTSQQIEVDTTGQAAATGGRNAVRWYELAGLDATPSVVQSGTVFDSTPSNPVHYWMGAIMPNGQGHVALGMSMGGATTRVNTAFTGRLATDAPGAMDAPQAYSSNTSFSYNQQTPPDTTQRWGDYSYTSVDPDDDMTFWTLQQYVNATNSYAVRLVRLLAPPPPAIASISPTVIDAGVGTLLVQVTGTASAGRGFFDPGAGFARRIRATVSGTGVTVTNVVVNSSTSLTLVLNTTGAAAGARTITITNPDGQTSSLAGALTVGVSTPAPPAFAGAPGDRTLFDAGSGASTGGLRFVVADPQGSPVTLTATSSNPAVIPQNRVQLVAPDGLGNASVAVSSIGAYGTSTITLTASDGTLTSTAVFVVTVSPSAIPGPPQGLGAIVTRNRVTFTWQAPASTAAEPVTGYRLEAGTAPGQTIAVILTGDVLSYTVFNAPSGVFFVRLRAQTAAGASAPSNEVQFATGQAGPPLPPLALLATVQGTAVSTQWTENPQGPIITGYQVRAGSAPGLTDIGVLPLPATARTFTANAPPGTYYLRVVAVNGAGAGVASNEAVIVAQPGTCTIPAVPTGVVASAQPGRLTLRWNAAASGAIPTSYIVYAGTTTGGTDRFAAGLPGTLTTASGLVPRGPYFIRMFATNACGASGPSLETSTTIP